MGSALGGACGRTEEVERALADETYRSIQARNASVTVSGRSIVDRWPQYKVLAARKERNPDFSPKAPLFVPLDPVEHGKAMHPGLKELADWQDDVSPASVPSKKSVEREGVSAFVARFTREIAQKFGARDEEVTVSIHIKQRTRNGEGFG